jgi:hypothetical protein
MNLLIFLRLTMMMMMITIEADFSCCEGIFVLFCFLSFVFVVDFLILFPVSCCCRCSRWLLLMLFSFVWMSSVNFIRFSPSSSGHCPRPIPLAITSIKPGRSAWTINTAGYTNEVRLRKRQT